MRPDGRAPDALRPVSLEPDFTDSPLASLLCRVGETLVLCTVSEEEKVPRFLEGKGRGWVTAEYSMLPGSTSPRAEREVSRGRPAGRSQEIQRLIGRSLRAAVDLPALGERTLTIDCDVLQADGGTRCASITGGFAALAIAARRLRARGAVERDPIRGAVAAVSVGIVDGEVRLDLPYVEDSRAEVDMNVVATGDGRLIEIQGTGEDGSFSLEQLSELARLALKGTGELAARQQQAIDAARA
ncbi:MAG: ribonuclease PH [Myxococcota bacterium]